MSDKPKILIIDDDFASLTSTKIVLEGTYNITATESPKEALLMLKNQTFDLILLDIFIPEMDGTQVLKFLHANYPNIPVIVLSGSVEWARRKDEAQKLGAIDYILKPYDINYLKTKVTEVIRAI